MRNVEDGKSDILLEWPARKAGYFLALCEIKEVILLHVLCLFRPFQRTRMLDEM